MFNNLIESSSHVKEFKRRGSFLLFTTATYLALFVVTGVVSIYAYDAHLEEQNLEVVTLLPPQEIVPDAAPDTPARPPSHSRDNDGSNVPERAVAMLSTSHPELPPEGISAAPNKNQPLPVSGPVRITGTDRGVAGPSGPGNNTGGQPVAQPVQIVIPDEPPPAPAPTPVVPKILRRDVVNGLATHLPKPTYPPLARQIQLQGSVNVQVLIDENGKVVSAKVVSGHPILVPEAQKAALQAKFSPTTIGGQPVKISGVIVYNFVIQR